MGNSCCNNSVCPEREGGHAGLQQFRCCLRRSNPEKYSEINPEKQTRQPNKLQPISMQQAHSSSPKKLFLSYSSSHCKEDVHEMAAFLKQQTFDVWIDIEKMSGLSFQEMAKGINEADLVLVFFSEQYLKPGSNSRRELEMAVLKKKKILVVRLQKDHIPDDAFLWLVGNVLWIDKFNNDDITIEGKEIVQLIRTVMGETNLAINEPSKASPVITFASLHAPRIQSKHYFNGRRGDEQNILNEVVEISNHPGILLLSGDQGLGKTTLVSRLFFKDMYFLNNSESAASLTTTAQLLGKLTAVIFINCTRWRDDEKFDEDAKKQFSEELLKDLPCTVVTTNIVQYFKEVKDMNVLFILDHVYNTSLLKYFIEIVGSAVACLVIVDEPFVNDVSNVLPQSRHVKLEPFSDTEMQSMLTDFYKIRLSEDQISHLAKHCFGSPLIASAIRGQFGAGDDNTSWNDLYDTIKSLLVDLNQSQATNVEKRSQIAAILFDMNIRHLTTLQRHCYFAFLFVDPAEPMALEDLKIFWGPNVDWTQVIKTLDGYNLICPIENDHFVLHEKAFDVLLSKATNEFGLDRANRSNRLHALRFKLVSGELQKTSEKAESEMVLFRAVKKERLSLLKKFVSSSHAFHLATVCVQVSKSHQEEGRTFLHFLYHTCVAVEKQHVESEDQRDHEKLVNFYYSTIRSALLKLKDGVTADDLLQVVSTKANGQHEKKDDEPMNSSFLLQLFNDELLNTQRENRKSLITLLEQWRNLYEAARPQRRRPSLPHQQPSEEKVTARPPPQHHRRHSLAPGMHVPNTSNNPQPSQSRRSSLASVAQNELHDTPRSDNQSRKEEEEEEHLVNTDDGQLPPSNNHQHLPIAALPSDASVELLAMNMYKGRGHVEDVESNDSPSATILTNDDSIGDFVSNDFTVSISPSKLPLQGELGELFKIEETDLYQVPKLHFLELRREAALIQPQTPGIQLSAGMTMTTMTPREKTSFGLGDISWTQLMRDTHREDLRSVKILCKKEPFMILHQDSNGWTPLMKAAQIGNKAIAEVLCETNSRTISQRSSRDRTALMIAAQNGQLELVDFLEKQQCNCLWTDKDGWTALMYAAENGHARVVRFLVDKHPKSVTYSAKNGLTALILACLNNYLEVVEILVKLEPKTVSQRDTNDWTPLMYAASSGNLKTFQLLFEIDGSALSKKKSKSGATPLIIASQGGHLEVVKFICEKCPQTINERSLSGWPAVAFAVISDNWKVVDYFCSINAEEQVPTALVCAALLGQFNTIQNLFQKYPAEAASHLNFEVAGWTALMAASQNGHLEIAKFLVEKDVECLVHLNSHHGLTATMVAAQNGHVPLVAFFFETKAMVVYQEDNAWWTPVMYAALNGRLEVVKYIFDKDMSSISHRSENLTTPLLLAAFNNHFDLVEFISLNNADRLTVAKDRDGWTALMVAAQNGHQLIVDFLVDRSTQLVTMANKHGRTAMMLAAQNGHREVVTSLSRKDPSAVQQRDNNLRSPLLLAALKGHRRVVDFLAEKHPKAIIMEDRYRWTPMIAAAYNGHIEVLKCFLGEKFVKIVSKHIIAETAFLADKYGRPEVALYLRSENSHSIARK